MKVVELLFSTMVLRPYVFLFLLSFLFASTVQFGFHRTICFLISGYFIAFASEFLSTRFGFPYGLYYYISEPTKDKELWILGVPFMDSLSYVFLAFFSYSFAIYLLSPIFFQKGRIEVVDTKKIRHSPSVLILASFLMVWLDILIDPVANQGDKWFLGKIYEYQTKGYYYGVPLSNFLGWLLVAFLIISSYQRIDILLEKTAPLRGRPALPAKGLYGVIFYFGVCAFITTVAWVYLENPQLVFTNLFILFPLLLWAVFHAVSPASRASEEELESHLRDFPESPLRKYIDCN